MLMDGQMERAQPRETQATPQGQGPTPVSYLSLNLLWFPVLSEPALNLAWTHAQLFCLINILMLCFQTNKPLKSRDWYLLLFLYLM